MRRVTGLATLSLGLAGAWLLPAPASVSASPAGTVCELQAVIEFDSPGLTTTPAPFTSDIVGALSSSLGNGDTACGSTSATAPSGTQTFDAGRPYTQTVSGSGWSVTYALPQSAGFGSCAMSTSSGALVADWPDGTHTVVDYSTLGVGAAWLLSGNVAATAVLNEVSSTGTPPPGTPTTFTVSSDNADFPVGAQLGGASAFISAIGDPTCSGTSFGGLTGVVEFSNT